MTKSLGIIFFIPYYKLMSHAFSNIENLTQQNTFFASAAMELEKPEYFLEYQVELP